jgi:O-antigen/teichoic acid export membrane protein
METLYGTPYLEARHLLATQIWLGVPIFLGVASGRWLIAEGLHMSYLARTIVGVCCNLLLNYLLIPACGPIGAVYATGLSQLVVLAAPCMPGLLSHGCDARRLVRSLVLFSYWNKTHAYHRD